MSDQMLFDNLPIGAIFDDDFGNTFIKTELLKVEIGGHLFPRNAITIKSSRVLPVYLESSPRPRPGHSGFFGER